MRITPPRRRRALAGVGLAAVAALALTACSVTGAGSGGGGQGDGTGTINALFMKQAGYSESDIGAMIKDFEAKNPKITVKPTFVAYEALHDKIVTSAPAGTYDVVHLDVIWPAEFASKGIITDVTKNFPSSWKSDMLGGALSSAEYKGKYYGVPWGPSTKLFFYNKDMLAKVGAGPDDVKTWDGVLAVAKKLKDAGIVQYPISWSWSQAEALVCDYAELLGAFGGQFTDSSGKLAINKGAGVQALEFMKKSLDEGLTDPASTTFLEDDTDKSMAAGKTAMELNWESTFRDQNDPSISKVVGQVAVTVPPAGPGGDNPGVNGSMALAIGSKSTHQAAAWKFIEYMTSEAVQDKYVTSSMTNWKASYDKPDITKTNPEVFAAAGKAYDSMILRPPVANYNTVSQALQVELQNALLGKKNPQQALDDAVAAANASLK
ncbi:extracellular solute-binding protein [Leifsonia shinshuensis]|uniref:Multiple sugar transport system substrate-binding protein n=1 Tax=Leifsonia shinshuensis TaxID=150026 RepID=A0A853CXT3_9MICO|nr:extracellular solute-binding protein [Leifsonia shinshuensis]NYJ25338.1 multiple sugar transport system substrate-binding protein [Leifsonia shinshuensis]